MHGRKRVIICASCFKMFVCKQSRYDEQHSLQGLEVN